MAVVAAASPRESRKSSHGIKKAVSHFCPLVCRSLLQYLTEGASGPFPISTPWLIPCPLFILFFRVSSIRSFSSALAPSVVLLCFFIPLRYSSLHFSCFVLFYHLLDIAASLPRRLPRRLLRRLSDRQRSPVLSFGIHSEASGHAQTRFVHPSPVPSVVFFLDLVLPSCLISSRSTTSAPASFSSCLSRPAPRHRLRCLPVLLSASRASSCLGSPWCYPK